MTIRHTIWLLALLAAGPVYCVGVCWPCLALCCVRGLGLGLYGACGQLAAHTHFTCLGLGLPHSTVPGGAHPDLIHWCEPLAWLVTGVCLMPPTPDGHAPVASDHCSRSRLALLTLIYHTLYILRGLHVPVRSLKPHAMPLGWYASAGGTLSFSFSFPLSLPALCLSGPFVRPSVCLLAVLLGK